MSSEESQIGTWELKARRGSLLCTVPPDDAHPDESVALAGTVAYEGAQASTRLGTFRTHDM